ncbi:MAG: zinc ribbon domain-containing protein [Actinomycetota bacterium]|nr:zinc ribbon domain-containing protein [Actinomycetota bacterium]
MTARHAAPSDSASGGSDRRSARNRGRRALWIARCAAAALGALAFCVVVEPPPVSAVSVAATTRVSVNSAGELENEFSHQPAISADGRYVAFFSPSSNLVPGDTNDNWDVFVHDRRTGETTRVSVDSAGAQLSAYSSWPSISGDGRYVAFMSNPLTNRYHIEGPDDVFVHDRQTGTTTLVSVPTEEMPNGGGRMPSISADGRYVAFEAYYFNAEAYENDAPSASGNQIFVRDLRTAATSKAVYTTTGAPSFGDNEAPSISADGRYVAFSSDDVLDPRDTNRGDDIYVRDLQVGTTTLVSVDSQGTPAQPVEAGRSFSSGNPSISADGRYVAFDSTAANLVPGDTNETADVFVHDCQMGTTTRVSVDSAGVEGDGDSMSPSVSADGRYIAFWSNASNLVAGDPGYADIFVRDVQTGTTTRVSEGSNTQTDGASDPSPSISADGRYVAFCDQGHDLVPERNAYGYSNTYVRDMTIAPLADVAVPPPSDVAGTGGSTDVAGTLAGTVAVWSARLRAFASALGALTLVAVLGAAVLLIGRSRRKASPPGRSPAPLGGAGDEPAAPGVTQTCPQCGGVVESGAVACGACGLPVPVTPVALEAELVAPAPTAAAVAAPTAPAVPMPTCPQCGGAVEPGAASCGACGLATPVAPLVSPAPTLPEPASTPPTEVTSTCPQCGAALPQGLAVCPACGLATSDLVPASTPSTAAPASANAGRGGTPRIALVVVAIVTVLLLACVLGWNALGLRDDGVDTPPESTSTPPPPPPPEPVVEPSSGPITTPEPSTAERTALMDAARLRLGIQNKFVVQGLFVQGDRAVGILNPEGTADYHLIAWARSGEVWTATWNGTPDAAGKAALEQAEPDLSPELIAQLGL